MYHMRIKVEGGKLTQRWCVACDFCGVESPYEDNLPYAKQSYKDEDGKFKGKDGFEYHICDQCKEEGKDLAT